MWDQDHLGFWGKELKRKIGAVFGNGSNFIGELLHLWRFCGLCGFPLQELSNKSPVNQAGRV